ncbi:MAG: chromosomal replication initiator protein DnaA [Myxococcaceae bacterium]|nr:chromosomal replication initiator protein DnaA [Myxococcaceae bacterium]
MTALAQSASTQQAAHALWHKTLEALRARGLAYAVSHLEKVRALQLDRGALRLSMKDNYSRDWIDDHYRQLICETALELTGSAVKLEYEVSVAPPPEDLAPAPIAQPRIGSGLNVRFTFETYVVADSNQLPAAAAHAVADAPGRNYNPLFIYGGTGLGKTHLLHAVGNRILQRNPASRIVYLSSEEFTNQFIESVRHNRMPDFRRRYRDECDVLLIDDIQFLGNKQETQNEFFYTFNALHQMSKAIVLTSDTVPSEIPGLEERLRSRFAMGLITDVQEPNYEMRIAILKKKAAQETFELPDEVAQFIARHVVRNVRELEGALIKLAAVHSLTKQPVNEALVAQVLKDLLPAKPTLDIETIQREVARYYKLTVEELKGQRRTADIAHARHVAIALSHDLTGATSISLGEKFGGRDHSTVLASIKKITELLPREPGLQKELSDLRTRLGVV